MTEEGLSQLEVRIDLDRRINFAMQQNDIPVVKMLHVENRGDAPLRDLQVRISTEPAFALGWSTQSQRNNRSTDSPETD
jgi:uncharacterized membrane protein